MPSVCYTPSKSGLPKYFTSMLMTPTAMGEVLILSVYTLTGQYMNQPFPPALSQKIKFACQLPFPPGMTTSPDNTNIRSSWVFL